MEIDGYARLTRSSFQVMDTPVAYSPFFLFPTKTNRQTGLLAPEFGRSDKKGVYYNQPFFWAINESSDLTVNEYFMDKRGFMHGIEYRARPKSDTTAWIRFDWLSDKRREMDDSGSYSGDGLVRTNYDRYWIRGMLDTRLPDPDWRLKMDLDYVSDQYFLSEFKSGFSGFTRSRNELFDLFNRDLKERSLDRVSALLLTREWERGGIALSAVYSQDPTLGNGNSPHSSDQTVQRLPQFDAFLHKGRILEALPLEFDASAQAAYMYRRTGTKGARYEVIPRMTLPVNTRYGSIIASAGLYQTLYDTELSSRTSTITEADWDSRDRYGWSARKGWSDAPKQDKDWRSIPEFNVAAFTEFARVFSLNPEPLLVSKEAVGTSRWTAFRHSIQPRVEFRHRANERQDHNPRYSSDDRLLAETELVYSITSVITTKQERVVMTKDEDGEMVPTIQTGYQDLLRLRLEQAYDQREATRDQDRDVYRRRPYGDILAELEGYVFDNVSLRTRNNWSPYYGEFTRHESGVNLNFPEYGRVYVGYDMRKALDEYKRYREDSVSYIAFDVETARVGPWSLAAGFRYDYKNTDNHETDIDLAFNHQCFKIIGRVSVEPQEENYQLMIQLTGLGD